MSRRNVCPTLAQNNAIYRHLARRSRHVGALRERVRHLELLFELAATLGGTLIEEDVFKQVLGFALDATGAERGFLLLLDGAGELVLRATGDRALDVDGDGRITRDELVAWCGAEQADVLLGRHDKDASGDLDAIELAALFRAGDEDGIVVPDFAFDFGRRVVASNRARTADLAGDVPRRVLGVPLRRDGRVLGALCVDARLPASVLGRQAADRLATIADQAGTALVNARLYRVATIDSLTRLAHRAYFEQRATEELTRCQRYGGDFAVVMLDIDHFKKFNDSYGHAVGDIVLRHVAGVLRAQIRTDLDLAARIGGEELVVLLPATDAEGARQCGERIRTQLAASAIAVPGHGELAVTVSLGVSSFPGHGNTVHDLMNRADQAMYASKHAGRNRLTVASA